MAETTPNLADLNLRVDRPATKVDHNVVARLEELRYGRVEKSAAGGTLGEIATAAQFVFGEVLDRNGIESREVREFVAFAERGLNHQEGESASDAFERMTNELMEKSSAEQVTELSQDMPGLKVSVEILATERSKAPELNGRVVGEARKKLGGEFMNATEQDYKEVRTFLAGMSKARGESLKTMGEMWDAQGDLDKANKVREIVDIGRNIRREDQYEFKMKEGTLGRLVSIVKRILPGGARRAERTVERTGKAANKEVDGRLADLRRSALHNGGDNDDVRMWKAGIVSRAELGNINLSEVTEPLSDDQRDALTKNKDLAEFIRDGEFSRVPQDQQIDYLHGFFANVEQKREADFVKARKEYLKYDVTNAKNWKVRESAEVVGRVAADTLLVPQFVKRAGADLAAAGYEGMITIGKGVGGTVEFGLDRMESVIAADGLEKLTSIVIAREAALDSLRDAVKSGADGEALLVAAKVVRGAEAAYVRAARYVGAVADTVSMTEGKGMLLRVALAIPEDIKGEIDQVTGGVFVGEHAGQVIKDLKDRMGLLDGDEVTSRNKEGSGNVEAAVQQILNRAEELGIPWEYMTKQGMDEYIESSVLRTAGEWIRQQVGPEGKFFGLGSRNNWKEQEWWKAIAGGSLRQSVDEVAKKLGGGEAETQGVIDKLSGQVNATAEKSVTNNNSLVETATAVVLKDAQVKLREAELKQVRSRARLDKMWSRVISYGAQATVVATVGVVASQMGGAIHSWSESAHIGLEQATARFSQVKEAADKVMEITRQAGMPGTDVGVNVDMLFARLNLGLAQDGSSLADTLNKNFLWMKLVSQITYTAAPIAAALPAFFESLPFRAKVRSTLGGPTGKVV